MTNLRHERSVDSGRPRNARTPGATHLFEESGALEQVAALASDWFLNHID
jgi:putative phosphoribosyl transferase